MLKQISWQRNAKGGWDVKHRGVWIEASDLVSKLIDEIELLRGLIERHRDNMWGTENEVMNEEDADMYRDAGIEFVERMSSEDDGL